MKDNLTTFSARAQALIESPHYFKKGLSSDFSVTTDKNDRILTVVHGSLHSDLEKIFAEVLSKFSTNKKIPEIWNIHFREIESFLRDENHLPAFLDEQNKLEIILEKLKISLIVSATLAALSSGFEDLSDLLLKWEKLNLAGKNAFLIAVLRPLGLELILYSEDLLTVTGGSALVENSALESVLQGIFKGSGKVLPMKVVAV